jgi:predicted permease
MLECIVMAAIGGALAIGVAALVLHALLALAPPELPRLDAVTFDWDLAVCVVVFSGALGVGLATIASRVATVTHPYQQLVARTPAQRTRWWVELLVVSQIAGGVVVLVGAGLTLRSLDKMLHIDLGFAGNRLLVGRLLPAGRYVGDSAWGRAVSRTIAAADAVPGVAGAAPMLAPPFTGHIGWDIAYIVDGQPNDALRRNPLLALYTATPESFGVLGIPLLAGRPFTSNDSGASPAVAIVSARVASTLWPGRDPIGQRIRLGDVEDPWETVVGVVADTRYRDLLAARGTVYRPHGQAGIPAFALAVRTVGDPGGVAATVGRVINGAPDARISGLVPVSTLAAPILARFRFAALLLSAVATAAILLALAGLYGTMASLVERRRHEIGVRIALGALPQRVAALIVHQGVRLAVGGIVLGACAASVGTRLLTSLLYGVTPMDPLTLFGVACLLVIVVICACWSPTRRAIRVDPISVIRTE